MTGLVSWTVIGFGIGTGVIVVFLYVAWEQNLQSEVAEQVSRREPRSLTNPYTEAELRDRIVEWSKTFPGDDVIRFHPNDYKADSILLPWENSERETEELWYFYSSYGFNNKPIVVYIEGTTGEIKGRKSALTDDQKKQLLKDPFQYSDRYNEFREHRRQRTRRFYGRNQSSSENTDKTENSIPLSEDDPR